MTTPAKKAPAKPAAKKAAPPVGESGPEIVVMDVPGKVEHVRHGLAGDTVEGPTPHEQVEAVEKTGDPIADAAAVGQNTVSAALAATAQDEALAADALERDRAAREAL